MKISQSTVNKITISDIERLDPINVFFEDYGEHRGKVTIEVCGDSWSYFWSNTARPTIKDFFLGAGTDYLVRKLKIGIDSTENDESQEALQKAAKDFILEGRKDGSFSKKEARDKWGLAESLYEGINANADDLAEIFGDDWWHCLPEKPNDHYVCLCRIVETIKSALNSEHS